MRHFKAGKLSLSQATSVIVPRALHTNERQWTNNSPRTQTIQHSSSPAPTSWPSLGSELHFPHHSMPSPRAQSHYDSRSIPHRRHTSQGSDGISEQGQAPQQNATRYDSRSIPHRRHTSQGSDGISEQGQAPQQNAGSYRIGARTQKPAVGGVASGMRLSEGLKTKRMLKLKEVERALAELHPSNGVSFEQNATERELLDRQSALRVVEELQTTFASEISRVASLDETALLPWFEKVTLTAASEVVEIAIRFARGAEGMSPRPNISEISNLFRDAFCISADMLHRGEVAVLQRLLKLEGVARHNASEATKLRHSVSKSPSSSHVGGSVSLSLDLLAVATTLQSKSFTEVGVYDENASDFPPVPLTTGDTHDSGTTRCTMSLVRLFDTAEYCTVGLSVRLSKYGHLASLYARPYSRLAASQYGVLVIPLKKESEVLSGPSAKVAPAWEFSLGAMQKMERHAERYFYERQQKGATRPTSSKLNDVACCMRLYLRPAAVEGAMRGAMFQAGCDKELFFKSASSQRSVRSNKEVPTSDPLKMLRYAAQKIYANVMTPASRLGYLGGGNACPLEALELSLARETMKEVTDFYVGRLNVSKDGLDSIGVALCIFDVFPKAHSLVTVNMLTTLVEGALLFQSSLSFPSRRTSAIDCVNECVSLLQPSTFLSHGVDISQCSLLGVYGTLRTFVQLVQKSLDHEDFTLTRSETSALLCLWEELNVFEWIGRKPLRLPKKWEPITAPTVPKPPVETYVDVVSLAEAMQRDNQTKGRVQCEILDSVTSLATTVRRGLEMHLDSSDGVQPNENWSFKKAQKALEERREHADNTPCSLYFRVSAAIDLDGDLAAIGRLDALLRPQSGAIRLGSPHPTPPLSLSPNLLGLFIEGIVNSVRNGNGNVPRLSTIHTAFAREQQQKILEIYAESRSLEKEIPLVEVALQRRIATWMALAYPALRLVKLQKSALLFGAGNAFVSRGAEDEASSVLQLALEAIVYPISSVTPVNSTPCPIARYLTPAQIKGILEPLLWALNLNHNSSGTPNWSKILVIAESCITTNHVVDSIADNGKVVFDLCRDILVSRLHELFAAAFKSPPGPDSPFPLKAASASAPAVESSAATVICQFFGIA